MRRETGDGMTTKRLAICVTFVLLVIGAPAVSAQMPPFAGRGGQMPDPKQMSGMPLQVPDLPVGTATARVIRGQLTNPLPDQIVELTGAGATKTASTDASGRATFSGLPPGSRVKMAVTVAGERVESQEFEVPAAGGVRVMLVATDAATEQKAADDRKLAQSAAVSGSVVLGDRSRFVLEIGDDALNVFNIMEVVNTAKRPVQTARPLVFELPANAVGVGMLEGSTPNGVAAGNRVTVNGPFAPGNTIVQFAYSIPLGSGEITVAEKMPAQLTQVSVVAQRLGGMELSSPQLAEHREMTAEGQNYIVGQGGAVRAGDSVSLTISGLPHRSVWPRNTALALATLIIATGVWSALRGRQAAGEVARKRTLQVERDKLFAQLASLEKQRRSGAVDAQSYASRREALVSALEDLYAGLDVESVA
jgi:hypothetical protein